MKTEHSTDQTPHSPTNPGHYLHYVVIVRCSGAQFCERISRQVAAALAVPQHDVATKPALYEDRSGLDHERSCIVLPGGIELPLDDDLIMVSLAVSLPYFATTHDVCEWALATECHDLPEETAFADMTFIVALLRRLPMPFTKDELFAVACAIAGVIKSYGLDSAWFHCDSLWRRLIRHTLASGSEEFLLELLHSSALASHLQLELCCALASEIESMTAESPSIVQCRVFVEFLLRESQLSDHWKRSLRSWARRYRTVLGSGSVN